MEHATPGVLLLMVLFVGPVLWFIRCAVSGKEIYIRRIPGIDAMDEAVGRAVELGRPISFTTATTGIGPLFYACLGAFRYVAKKAARFGSRIYYSTADPEALVLADATMQNAYKSEKRLSQFDSTSLRFLSSEQFAFASGYMGLVERERVAAAFLFGSFAAESLILAEAGQRVGALQVAATTDTNQVPFFITVCDYTLIGEELYAAGAYLSNDPVQTGSLRGQDFAKLILVALIVLGIFEATARSYFNGKPETLWLDHLQKPWSAYFGSEGNDQ